MNVKWELNEHRRDSSYLSRSIATGRYAQEKWLSHRKYSQEYEVGRGLATNTLAASHAQHRHNQHSQSHPEEPLIPGDKHPGSTVKDKQGYCSKGYQELTLQYKYKTNLNQIEMKWR